VIGGEYAVVMVRLSESEEEGEEKEEAQDQAMPVAL
jgi:hypothetical protein